MTFSFNGTVRDGQRSSLPRRTLLCGAAIASVLSAAGAADAQSTAPAGGADTSAAQVTEVVVTASRIAREGYTAPTPTTAVGRDQIDAQAPVSVADFVNELPALVG